MKKKIDSADIGNTFYVYNQNGMYLSPTKHEWMDSISQNEDPIGLQLFEITRLRENQYFKGIDEVSLYLKDHGTDLAY